MYIDIVPNHGSKPSILLRESYREGKRVLKRTHANITKWPQELIDAMRILVKGGKAVEILEEAFEIVQSLPYGHVAAVVGTIRRLGLDKIIATQRCRERDLVLAMIAARILAPGSKLATARGLDRETAVSALGDLLVVESASEDDLYGALDWLLPRQERIEDKLARKHLAEGSLILYDLTSSYFEGRKCPLARLGYPRDKKKGKLQIVFGMLCTSEGCPVAVEVFEGNTGDPSTLSSQVKKVSKRFGLKHVIFVGDRGMITQARIDEDLRDVEGLEWITALRSPAIGKLLENDYLQPSLFDETDLAEIDSPDYPDERLVACRNPFLAVERERKRKELIARTAGELDKIVLATQRNQRPLRGKDKIGERLGKIINRYKVGKYFRTRCTPKSFSYELDEERIARDRALDGIYVIRTSVSAEDLSSEDAVRAYKSLSNVEKAFRTCKSVDLKLRPIHHHLEGRVRAHVFVCMLAYYVEWHMRQKLAPILFEDDDKQTAESLRHSVVAPAQRSPKAKRKAQTKKTHDEMPVHSFNGLMVNLGTIVKNRITSQIDGVEPFYKITQPSQLQRTAFDLLGVKLICVQ